MAVIAMQYAFDESTARNSTVMTAEFNSHASDLGSADIKFLLYLDMTPGKQLVAVFPDTSGIV